MDNTELLIEFECGQSTGSVSFSGRDVFGVGGRKQIRRQEVVWRLPEGWEEELLLLEANALPPETETEGPAMLGEGGTLFHWDQSDPYWVFAETEEEGIIEFFSHWSPAFLLSICRRPDCRTARFCIPASLMKIEEPSCVP